MKSVSGKQFAATLERHGWQLLRVNGSHHIYGKPRVSARITVPIHGNTNLKSGLLSTLLKLAGLSESDL
jgi:predicted RNA binding protein YcfA (HicA-like mRNA interferase family)